MNFINDFKGIVKNKKYQRLTVVIATVIVLIILIVKGGQPQKYDLAVKQYSSHDIFAPRDVIDKYTKDKLESEAIQQVELKYTQDSEITKRIETELEQFFKKMFEIRSSNISRSDKLVKTKAYTGVKLSDKDIDEALSLDSVDFNLLSSRCKEILKEKLDDGVKEESLLKVQEEIKKSFQNIEASQELKSLGENILAYVIKPNTYVDMEATRIAREQAKAKVQADEYTYRKGRKIVSKGEEITPQHIELLRELGMLKNVSNNTSILPLIGGSMVVMLLSAMVGMYMQYFNKRVYFKVRELSLLCVISVVTLLASISLHKVFVFIVPITFAVMLISIFLDKGLAVISNFALTLLIAMAMKLEPTFIYSSIISGTFAAFMVNNISTRSKLMFYGIIISVINMFTVIGMGLLDNFTYLRFVEDGKNAFFSVFFSTIFVIGTLPLWESIFNIVSPFKLLELSNANQPLLKRLMIEAPGTYHHSLMVGNLAEAGAEVIGANGLFARVAAYYHDIGKLRRPYFYKENQFNDNIHAQISATTSASLITSHTKDGLTYADQYKIPPQIKDIIEQHHGTTLVAYFYHAAQKEDAEANISEDDFRYKGPKPQSRESAVVMLADSVEAAVRSIAEPSEEKMNMMIKKIIKDKLDDGQLDDCNITLMDIDKISKAFMNVLSGLFHQRIEYPEIVNNTAKKLNEVDPLEQRILKL